MIAKLGKHLLGFVLFLFVFSAGSYYTGLGNDKAFDADLWLRSNSRMRGRMAQDLVNKQCLVGKTVDEVGAQLGVPDKDWGKVHQYRIDLGWPFKKPLTYGLQVHFNADRNVSLVRIVD